MKYPRHLLAEIVLTCFSFLLITTTAFATDSIVSQGSRIERGVLEMYEEDDLSSCCLFTGGLINFGYWDPKITNDAADLTLEQRLNSSKNLYYTVANKACISSNDSVLEVGCGQGVGAGLILKDFHPHQICGIDFSQAQINKAKITCNVFKTESAGPQFIQGSAEKIPYESSSFNKVYSIEAAQHFENLKGFANESYRVLKPSGKLVVATFFATAKNSDSMLATHIQTVKDGIDKIVPISDFKEMLEDAGYTNVKVESIGENVWYGFDKWVSQGDLKDSWTRNWLKGYEAGLIDYFIVTADKEAA